MTTETPLEKAHRYLVDGHLTVTTRRPGAVVANCRGSGQSLYAIAYTRDSGWACTCPARVHRCAHIIAADLVTQPHLDLLTAPTLDADPTTTPTPEDR